MKLEIQPYLTQFNCVNTINIACNARFVAKFASATCNAYFIVSNASCEIHQTFAEL